MGMVHVHDPVNLAVENLLIGESGSPKNAVDLLQTGSGMPTRMHYDGVKVSGMYTKAPRKGLRCRNLPQGSTIVADHFNGNVRFTGCSGAKILFNTSFEGMIQVERGEGAQEPRDGMLGFLTRLATINSVGLIVRNSQSIVMSDYYVESAERLMDFQAESGDPAGRITIQMAKSHCSKNPVIDIQNYCGRITLGHSMFYPGGVHPALVTQQGANPCQVQLMACQAYNVSPEFRLSGSAKLTLLENAGRGMGGNQTDADSLGQVREHWMTCGDLRLWTLP